MSKELEILFTADPCTHGRDVKTKECPADGAARQVVSKYCKQQQWMDGWGDLQAGEDVDIPDSIHGCCGPRESGQRGRSLGGQVEVCTGLDEGDVGSIYCRLQCHVAQQGYNSNAMLGSMLVQRLQERPCLSMWVAKDVPPKGHPHQHRTDPMFGRLP